MNERQRCCRLRMLAAARAELDPAYHTRAEDKK